VVTVEDGAESIASSGYHDDAVMANFKDFGFSNAISKQIERALGE